MHFGTFRGTSQNAWNVPTSMERPYKRGTSQNGQKKAGDVLLSHAVTHAVPSTQKSLTSEFGMGSGVASSLISPARLLNQVTDFRLHLCLSLLFQRGGEASSRTTISTGLLNALPHVHSLPIDLIVFKVSS